MLSERMRRHAVQSSDSGSGTSADSNWGRYRPMRALRRSLISCDVSIERPGITSSTVMLFACARLAT